MTPEHPLLRWFDTEHIRDEEIAYTITQFRAVAEQVDLNIPNGAEKTAALRKLVEAKDAACRAVIEGRE